MRERLVLGLTGFSGTGKTTLANYLAKEHGFSLLEGSALIRKRAEEAGMLLDSRNTYEAFFREQQLGRGLDWISETMLTMNAARLLQVGLRSPADLRNIQRVGGKVIGLVCPPALCVSRIDTANPKNPATVKEYIEHQAIEESANETGSHTALTVDNADYTLDTSRSIECSYAQLDSIVAELTGSSRLSTAPV